MSNNESKIVFYGAGKNARIHLKRWEASGLHPVCFADQDQAKQNTMFLGKYNVLSPGEAMNRYPDCDLYITAAPDTANKIAQELEKSGIVRERIKFPDSFTYRRGCQLGNIIISSTDRSYYVKCCCGPDCLSAPYRFEAESVEQGVKLYYEAKEKIIALQGQEGNPCEKCASYRFGHYCDERPITTVTLESGFRGDICNERCVYCREIKKDLRNRKYSVLDALTEILKIFHDSDITLGVGHLEFACCEHIEKEIDLILRQDWKINAVSNGTVLIPQLIDAAKKGRTISIHPSIDAGTPETYQRIKGLDCFQEVVSNLAAYSQAGIMIDLKYIFIKGLNDNSTDINGFFKAVSTIKPSLVVLSRMNQFIDTPLTEHERQMVCLFLEQAKKQNIRTSVLYEMYNFTDAEFLRELESACNGKGGQSCLANS